MNPQVRQPGISTQTIPDFVNRCVRLPVFDVDEKMVIPRDQLPLKPEDRADRVVWKYGVDDKD